jgi:hypothetical protein
LLLQSKDNIEMGVLNKALDLTQKGAVMGMLSVLGYQMYQIGYHVYDRHVENKYMHTQMFEKLSSKVEEESKLKDGIDQIPDRYDREDNTYLKRVPNMQEPVKK